MPSPEHPRGPRNSEREPSSYFQVSRFEAERLARATYSQIQDLLFENRCDLSTYRFLLENVSHVAVLGHQPPQELEPELRSLLDRGEAATVPLEVRAVLEARRRQATQIGPWVEGHYRPGKPLRGDNTP